MICPKCGLSTNSWDNDDFCECKPRPCHSCGEDVEEKTGIFCNECGAIIRTQLAKGEIYLGIGNVKRLGS